MALLDPDALAIYDAFYSRLALTEGPFTEFEKEYIWLGIILTGREAIGTHHLHKFRAESKDPSAIASVFAMVAMVEGSEVFSFPSENWGGRDLGINAADAYLEALLNACRHAEVPERLVHLGAAAICVCRRRWPQLALHIQELYRLGTPENEILEALAFTMLPAGAPNFINACAVWKSLVESGRVPAGPTVKAWAMMPLSGFGSVSFPDVKHSAFQRGTAQGVGDRA
ncbi:carboxymuconolactone decarboxylase family protein [Bradyrhizobium sp. Pear76]|uniref:carboxymuconolactone decarboxylase family protein n=1 Tax=Bradyrhizobium oropedii TaxID=1571201 RepID=UPI001E2B992F|nr:carboxymuconolactone decarboxylase family protein [Bradyrhizobium oropedii]MCC8967087.1 carboxymuconolactone decarboxylase family protein [Bradyrhizobium oropedii]